MKSLVNILKAIGDENRLRILLMLRQRPLCVCEIYETLNIAFSTISQHLKHMRSIGLIEDSKEGRWVLYTLVRRNNFVNKLLEDIEQLLYDDPHITTDRETIAHVTRESCSFKLKEQRRR